MARACLNAPAYVGGESAKGLFDSISGRNARFAELWHVRPASGCFDGFGHPV